MKTDGLLLLEYGKAPCHFLVAQSLIQQRKNFDLTPGETTVRGAETSWYKRVLITWRIYSTRPKCFAAVSKRLHSQTEKAKKNGAHVRPRGSPRGQILILILD